MSEVPLQVELKKYRDIEEREEAEVAAAYAAQVPPYRSFSPLRNCPLHHHTGVPRL